MALRRETRDSKEAVAFDLDGYAGSGTDNRRSLSSQRIFLWEGNGLNTAVRWERKSVKERKGEEEKGKGEIRWVHIVDYPETSADRFRDPETMCKYPIVWTRKIVISIVNVSLIKFMYIRAQIVQSRSTMRTVFLSRVSHRPSINTKSNSIRMEACALIIGVNFPRPYLRRASEFFLVDLTMQT